jgi:hypothetical protein
LKNIRMEVEGDLLTMIIDLSKLIGPSSSGKTILVASTLGNVPIPGHPGMEIGVNAYKAKPARK